MYQISVYVRILREMIVKKKVNRVIRKTGLRNFFEKEIFFLTRKRKVFKNDPN